MNNQFDPNNEFNQQTEEFNQLGSEFQAAPLESFTVVETTSVEEVQPQNEVGTKTADNTKHGKKTPKSEPTKIAKMMNRFFIVSTTVVTSIIAVAVFLNTRVNIINYHVGVDFVSYHIELLDIGDYAFEITLEGVGDKRSNNAVEGINEGHFMNLKPETYYTLKVEGDSEFGRKVYESVRFKTEPLLSRFNRVNLIKDEMNINEYHVTLDVLVDGMFIAELKSDNYYNTIYLTKGMHDYVFSNIPSKTQFMLRVYEFIEQDHHGNPTQPHPRDEFMEKVEILKEVTSEKLPIDINHIYFMNADNFVYLNLEYDDPLPPLSNVEIVYALNNETVRIGLDYENKLTNYPLIQLPDGNATLSAHLEYTYNNKQIKTQTKTFERILPPVGNISITPYDRPFEKLISNITIEHVNDQKAYTLEIVENGLVRDIISLNDNLTFQPGSLTAMIAEIELTNIHKDANYQLILREEENELSRKEVFYPNDPMDYITLSKVFRSGSNEELYHLDINLTSSIEILETLRLQLEIKTSNGTNSYTQEVNFDTQTHSFDVDAPYGSEYRIIIKDDLTGEQMFYDSGFILSKNANRILTINEVMYDLENEFMNQTYVVIKATKSTSTLSAGIEYTITPSSPTTAPEEGFVRVETDEVKIPVALQGESTITLKPYQGIDHKDYDETITLAFKRTAKIVSVSNMRILNSPSIILAAPDYELGSFIVEFRDLNDEIVHELVPDELSPYQDYRMHQSSFEFTPDTNYKVRLKDVDNMYYGDEQTYNAGPGIIITNIVFTDAPAGGSTISFDYELVGDYSAITSVIAKYGKVNVPEIHIDQTNGEPRTGHITSNHAVLLENRHLEIRMDSQAEQLIKVIPLN